MVEPYPASPEPPPPVDPLDRPLRGATIAQAFVRFWQKYGTFTGRASRSEYWWAFLVNSIISLVLEILARSSGIFGLLLLLFALASIVPNLAINARRLHDTDRSGWWQLLELVPIVGAIILIVWYATGPRPEGVRFDT